MLHILFRIEETYGAHLDQGSAKYSLEHILPQNPESGWPQFNHEETQDWLNRIGNCAILETSLNRDLGNCGFAGKKAVFAKSDIVTTRMIAEDNLDWDTGRIALRQKQMAKRACSVWRIGQLG